MTGNWKKYLELIIIGFCLFTLILLYSNVAFSERLIVVSFATLSLYYLLSGALVLFNKQIGYAMRLIYFIGLWSVSIGIIGIIYKIKFWMNSEMLLILAFSFSLVVLVFMFTYYRSSKDSTKPVLKYQLSPIIKRLAIYPLVFLTFYWLSHYDLYITFGEHRHDPHYTEVFIDALRNPDDLDKQHALKELQIEKGEIPDDNQRDARDYRRLD